MAPPEEAPGTGMPLTVNLKLKYGWPFPDMKDPPLSFKVKSSIIIPLVGTFSKILLKWCNSINGHNIEQLQELVGNRPAGVPLVTVSNHYSCIDDPTLWGLLRWRELWSAQAMRWSPAAHDIAFTRRLYNWFFSSGKCVPIIRGLGVYQEAMDFLIERLQAGQWVHIFPEGKVNMSMEHMRLKWGVGRLVYESSICPIVLPFYHIGMDTILPNRSPYIPRVGKTVTVVVGEPMDFKQLVSEMKEKQEDPATARKIITDRIQDELKRLRGKAEELHEKMLQQRNR
ncbi:tafazzin-like [Homarus americanus]|uniref:Tafazzin family protein n=1 Tax=Homarus americanus TaxID=6706 RepID=A0A8J5K093_HOMAM|nr:tafazzin-like [Homarus americanus]KAG7164620.1 Tafazzin-like [Homarus americanus]